MADKKKPQAKRKVMKGKPTMQESMGDHAKNQFAEEGTLSVLNPNTMNKTGETYNQEEAKAKDERIKNYNSTLVDWSKNPDNIDSSYQSLLPMKGLIVRCFHLTMDQKEGSKVLLPIKSVVLVPTANGMGVREATDSPYQYDTVAVVIKASKNLQDSFTPGQQIILRNEATACRKVSKDAPFEMALGFAHPRWRKMEPPTDIENQDYGYLHIDPFQHARVLMEDGTLAIS